MVFESVKATNELGNIPKELLFQGFDCNNVRSGLENYAGCGGPNTIGAKVAR